MPKESQKEYKKTIEQLGRIEQAISEWEKFLERLLNGKASGVRLCLSMDKKNQEEESAVQFDEDGSLIQPGQPKPLPYDILGSFRFAISVEPEKPKRLQPPDQPIAEEIAIQLCQMIRQKLIEERNALLSILTDKINQRKLTT